MNKFMANAAAFLRYGPLAMARRVRHTDPNERRQVCFNIGRYMGDDSLLVVLGSGRTFEAAFEQAKESPLGREIEAAMVKYEEKLKEKHKEKANGGTE